MTKLTMIFCLGCSVVTGVGVVVLLNSQADAPRQATLEQRVEQINQAQTVDDLRPILMEIVRRQR
jgi:hypothetical protein